MSETTHEFVGRLLHEIPGAERFEIPPPVFRELGGEFVDFEAGRSLTAEWPVSDRHRGPSGRLQGGILAAYFDNTVGPLAFLAGGGFYVSVDLSTEFLRPVLPGDETVVVTVEGDSLVDVSPVDGGGAPPLPESEYRTVEGLFAQLREWRDRDPADSRMEFHDRLGYPTEAFFDFRRNVADEEQGFEVTDLRALERLQ